MNAYLIHSQIQPWIHITLAVPMKDDHCCMICIQYNTLLFMITDLKENTAVTLFLCSCSMKITIGSPTVLNVESY